MRHASVNLCALGGLSFYLMMRFQATHEFEDFTVSDWLDNSKWFDVKLLVDASVAGVDYMVPMSNDSYSKAIKETLKILCIAAYHLVHIGRGIGPKILESLDEETDEIRRLGNWKPSIFDSCYSSKLPMQPIRKMAGFVGARGMHYNRRTTEEVGDVLLRQTAIGGWIYEAYDGVKAAIISGGLDKFTALNFLACMKETNKIFLQDAAAMLIEFPERSDHPMFRMPVFQSSEFEVSFFVLFLSYFLCCLF